MKMPLLLLTLLLAFHSLSAQGDAVNVPLTYEINQIYPYLSVTSTELATARTLSDLNRRYKSEWVKEFRSVEVLTCRAGNAIRTVGSSEVLTDAQLAAIKSADTGREITVRVNYLPNNTLTHNEEKELEFTLTVDPDQAATFPEDNGLNVQDYLWQNAVAGIPAGTFTGYDLAAVTFSISKTGVVEDVALFQSSGNREVDDALLTAVRTMPTWTPARYADGTIVSQDFALTVGNQENCMVNLLNTRKF